MIENWYNNDDAAQWLADAGEEHSDRDLALRVYTSRLIGQNPDLVMHGGGNTSVKVKRKNLFGNLEDVLHVKGSGWDLDVIEAPGLPGVRLEPLKELRNLSCLSDEEMVNVQRSNLLNSSAPNPSVETLLHAFIPHKYVDHTHATPFLILANLPNAEHVCREIFGDRLGIVPYIMPGFELAKKAAEIYDMNPRVEGLLLLNHGHFAFGSSAKESYDLIVRHTNEVASYFQMTKVTSLKSRDPISDTSIIPVLRGVIAETLNDIDAQMPIFDIRNGAEVMDFFKRKDVEDLSKRGMASPDHVIRTKGRPLFLRENVWRQGREAIRKEVLSFQKEYKAYFNRQAPRASEPKKLLPPDPKHAWVEGVGLIGIGSDAKAASISADLAEQNLRVRAIGEDYGGFFPLGEKDLFDCEYWSLEQAKLGKGRAPKFQGKVVMITGGAGAIGLATAKAFVSQGAHCFLVDLDSSELKKSAKELGVGNHSFAGDITNPQTVADSMEACVTAFGGLDILISNAGAAHSGAMLDIEDKKIREAFELNFFAHRNFSIAAAKLMQTQGRPGQIIFNISKQAVNPGKNLGAYGLPKATTLFLMKQLALELGEHGIRVNGINADRIRSGLLTENFISERASARGISKESYMAGNILKREVKAHHVAQAFVNLAALERTTAHVLTVDGGNIEASLR